MADKVYMEALSPTMEEGQVVKWHKAEGDAVAEGDVLADIETDKATMELVARGGGVLRGVFATEGAVVPVGEVIAVIGGADEDVSAVAAAAWGGGSATERPGVDGASVVAAQAEGGDAGSGPGDVAAALSPASGAGPAPERPAGGEPVAAAAPTEPLQFAVDSLPGSVAGPSPAHSSGPALPAPGPPGPQGRVKASPVARRLAREMDVDLHAVAGSGPAGRVVKRDVEAAAEAAAALPVAVPVAPPFLAPPDGLALPEHEDVPLTQMRKTVARRLAESLGPVPHFFLTVDMDMSRALEARARINQLLEPFGGKASLNDLVVKAAAAALVRHPECNAWWQDDRIRRFNRVHMGVAVAVPDGLITPVVRDAQAKGLGQISAEVRELAARAREKKLQPHEYTGSTFSISNLGMFGIEEFTAVINPPEAGILAVGAVEERAVVVDGAVVPRPRMRVTMSCDHRVVDGAQGARFLATLKAFLEEPAAILA